MSTMNSKRESDTNFIEILNFEVFFRFLRFSYFVFERQSELIFVYRKMS